MIFSPNETKTREEYRELQLDRLQKTVRNLYEHAPYYRKKMDAARVRPEQIRSLDDIRRLPFTEKDDFRTHFPYGMLVVPRDQVIRIQMSSGTSGKPTLIAYTKNDVAQWTDLDSRISVMAGIRRNDVVQIANGYGMFAGAFGHDFGCMNLGALVVPSSSGHSERQLQYMQELGVTTLIATPTYVLHLGLVAAEHGVDIKALKLRNISVGGEGMTEQMRDRIHELWGEDALVTENYGMCELGGTGISGECEVMDGMHIEEDCFFPEIIDPKTGENLPEGESGELVITTLSREAIPLIRYRTRDITRLMYGPCKCGRTNVRMDKILGRTDQMLVIRGINVFPSQFEAVLFPFKELQPSFELLVYTKEYLDRIKLRLEAKDPEYVKNAERQAELTQRIRCALKTALHIDIDVELNLPGTFPEVQGKVRHIIDQRTSGSKVIVIQ